MDMGAVVSLTGVPTWPSYETKLDQSPHLLAWLMQPPPSYKLQILEAQELGLDRLSEILTLPIRDPKTGKINTGVGLLILQAIKMVDSRIHGKATERHVQITADAGKIPEGASMDMEAVDRRIRELESALTGVPLDSTAKPPAKDVDSTVDEGEILE